LWIRFVERMTVISQFQVVDRVNSFFAAMFCSGISVATLFGTPHCCSFETTADVSTKE
jgi:hypothetical protein